MGTANALIEDIFKSARKKKVVLRAPVFTCSGYGIHSRQVAEWLMGYHRRGEIELQIQALNWGATPWYLNEKMLNGMVGEMQSLCTQPGPGDVSFQLQLPNEWDTSLAAVNIGITAAVETDRCNPQWIAACNRMTHIVVPSEHIKRTLEASGNLTVPVSVIPEAFPREFLVYPDGVTDVTKQLDALPTKFNFLLFGQLTGDAKNDRKNTYNTLRWISEIFDGDKEVGIVLKTNSARNTRIDRNVTQAMLTQALHTFRKPSSPPVYLLHGDMTSAELRSLYVHPSIKALVSLSRGEGWGLPLLEAAALGKPVISTAWSGHMDFMSLGKSITINYDLKEIPKSRVDNAIWMPGTKWAEPKEADFKQKITKFRGALEIPTSWAAELATKIREKFSPDAVLSAYDRELGKYLGGK